MKSAGGSGAKIGKVSGEVQLFFIFPAAFALDVTAGQGGGIYGQTSAAGSGRAASPLVLRTQRLQSIFRRPRPPSFRAAYAVLITAGKVVLK